MYAVKQKSMLSSIETVRPEIELLKMEVEKKLAISPKSPSDFTTMTLHIKKLTSERLNEFTLMRLWGYTNKYKSIRRTTLNILSQAVGFNDWDSFVEYIITKSKKESGLIDQQGIFSDSLSAGERLKISWLPDRVTVISYLGGNKFQIESIENASWGVGDTFYCRQFIIGEPLYVDKLQHTNGKTDKSYAVGMMNGLVEVCKLS